MEKKFKFSDKAMVSKIVYLTVIAILCVSAIVIGIVAANSRKKVDTTNPGVSDTDGNKGNEGSGSENNGENSGGNNKDDEKNENQESSKELTYSSPVVGTVMKSHSTGVPVFSNTMDEWRIHTGIDILADVGSEVCSSAKGEVSGVYVDPMHGKTVEITHTANVKTYYSNLSADSVTVSVGDKVEAGDLIGVIGDTTVIELADEPHLHFELKVNGESVNPIDYLSQESKKSALGIVSGEEI